MHRFSRMHLSPEVAMRSLDAIDLEEKARIAESVALIAVLDHRRDYLAAGYASMCRYCIERLHMSEDQALRRIQVARVALRFPEVFEHLAAGRLTLTTAAMLAPHLQPETAVELLAAAAFRAKPEITRLLAERSRPAVSPSCACANEPLVEISSKSHAPAHVISLADLCAPPAGEGAASSLAPGRVNCPRRGRVSSSLTGDYDVRLSITDEEHEVLVRAQALLGHAVPSGDPALVYARAMKHYVAHLEKQRLGVKRDSKPSAPDAPAHPNGALAGRSIPRALRRLVWERDGGCCAFVGTDGHRCGGTVRLELDHIQPVALGGQATPENLRLLCRAHNQHAAERTPGKEHVQRAKELAQRERARARAARSAAAAKARPRAAARHPHHDDILAALRGLGFNQARARRGVELAAPMPDASLETCVRHALIGLTRAVAMRGERRARCTA